MPIPPYVAALRAAVGHAELWLPGVTAVIVRDDHVLLNQRSDNGQWAPITGIVDPGEDPGVCARREAMEETGVEISVDRLVSVSVSPRITHANGDLAVYLDHTFRCSWVSGEPHPADDESLDVRWWPLSDLPPVADHLARRIDDALAGEVAARFRT